MMLKYLFVCLVIIDLGLYLILNINLNKGMSQGNRIQE